jgi:hypothetical protein
MVGKVHNALTDWSSAVARKGISAITAGGVVEEVDGAARSFSVSVQHPDQTHSRIEFVATMRGGRPAIAVRIVSYTQEGWPGVAGSRKGDLSLAQPRSDTGRRAVNCSIEAAVKVLVLSAA